MALPIFSSDTFLDEEVSDGEVEETSHPGEIRFGTAADFTTAACFEFLTDCCRDNFFCRVFISYITKEASFVTGILKFFGVASQKTIPHVCFQKEVIVSVLYFSYTFKGFRCL